MRTMRSRVPRKLLWVVGAILLTLLLVGCGKDLPQNTFNPAGPTAQSEKDVLILPLIIAGIVFVGVEGGIVFLAIKFRHRRGKDQLPSQLHGNTRLEISWTIVPAVLLAVVMVPAISMIWHLADIPPNSMEITVQGYQWWWGFQYMDEDMKVDYGANGPITTADVLVIPAGQTINLSLRSEGGGARSTAGTPDHQVIHSFWAPRLFGKQDVMPGAAGEGNHIVFSANEPGTYYGQCAEFCGLQHALMKFRIVALDATDWAAWVQARKSPAPTPPPGSDAEKGMQVFFGQGPAGEGGGQCIACHAIGGAMLNNITAESTAAPNLTDFGNQTHLCFAGCDFETFVDGNANLPALRAWLENPDAVKLGAKMPDYNLSDQQIDYLMAYLYSLSN
jgi:cytochrome c oxidase subunit 2